jgi:GntR family transcriptional regulator/MocR family aminotransferase
MKVEGTTSGPELLLALDRSAGALRGQLEQALRAAIRAGRLAPGGRLPSSRVLAADLGVSRGLVVEAYAQLTGEGYLEARPGSATRVAPGLLPRPSPAPGTPDHPGTPRAGLWTARDPESAGRLRSPTGGPGPGPGWFPTGPGGAGALPTGSGGAGALGGFLPGGASSAGSVIDAGEAPSPRLAIDFRPGVPELAGFPRVAWAGAVRRVVLGVPAGAFGYGDPAGAAGLRVALADYLGRVRGVAAGGEDVLVTAGFAQALALLARALPARLGTPVAVEDPGSPGTREQLAGNGLEPVPVAVDEEGLRVEELARSAARMVVVTPAHQAPTGVVLSPARRAALLAWARASDGLIVEDDYDAEYRYDRDPVGALQGLAPDLVCYAGSVSKTLAPALRIGWMVPPPALRPDLVRAKADDDLGCPTLEQLALADLLGSGAYDRHLRRSRARYRRRRDALVAALARHTPGLRAGGTAAGLHAVVVLADDTDEAELVRRAATEAGVGLHGLTPWRVAAGGAPGLVLGYASLTEHQIAEGIRRVAALLPGRG